MLCARSVVWKISFAGPERKIPPAAAQQITCLRPIEPNASHALQDAPRHLTSSQVHGEDHFGLPAVRTQEDCKQRCTYTPAEGAAPGGGGGGGGGYLCQMATHAGLAAWGPAGLRRS